MLTFDVAKLVVSGTEEVPMVFQWKDNIHILRNNLPLSFLVFFILKNSTHL